MSFFTSRNNMRSAQPNRRLVPPPPMRRPMPKPQMSRPIQPVRPPTGLPQQISAPTGMPNVNQPPLGMPNQMLPPIGLPNINQPPIGLPNINEQPTGLPPTQTQLPTPPAVPVEQSNSMFAPPQQAMPIEQPAIAPVFQPPPQMAPPQNVQTIDPSLAERMPDPIFQPPPQMAQPTPQPEMPSIQPPPNIYGGLTPGEALGGEFTMGKYRKEEPVAGPVAPDWQYNSDKTMRSVGGVKDGNLAYRQSQTYDPITGQWGMPGGEGGNFMPGLSIGY